MANDPKASSQVRLFTPEGQMVIPEGAVSSDDSPTVISKKTPAQESITAAFPQSNESFSGSLRGRKLAHFELIEPIGVGGMAAVIRAQDTQLERLVALKILPPEMSSDPENVKRFHQEARAAAKLDHENIARVFFCGEDQNLHFIAFEFVEGENLRTILEKRGRLPVPEAVRYMLQIAAGLEHSASRGVVHRDIKPSNIIITPTGRAKLVDMGLARSLSPHDDKGLTHSGVTLGTFDYISPEQALEPRQADARSDIYSLGCTFYHILTGFPPVPEGTAAKKMHHHQHVAPLDPRHLNLEIPDEVAAILHRMMAKDPRDRYQRPVHLVQHLMHVAHKVGAADDLPEGGMIVDVALPGEPRNRPFLVASLAVLALVSIVAALSWFSPQVTPPNPKTPPPSPNFQAKESPLPSLSGPNFQVKNNEDLARLLSDKSSQKIVAKIVGQIDLEKEPTALVFSGKGNLGERTLIVEPGDRAHGIFSFKYQGDESRVSAGLILDGGKVTFRNLKFIIEAHETPLSIVAMLAVQGSGTATFQNCVFEQKVPLGLGPLIGPNRYIPVSSIAVDSKGDEKPKIVLEHCKFLKGQVAIALHGPAEVLPSDCVFGPHAAHFHLRGEQSSHLNLNHCTALVVYGPVFRLDGAAQCTLEVRHSIFSSPKEGFINDQGKRDFCYLIRQTESEKRAFLYKGNRNVYHNLEGFFGDKSTKYLDEMAGFRDFLYPGWDKDSSKLDTNPFVSDNPLAMVIGDPLKSLQVRSDLAPVRIPPDMTRAVGISTGEPLLAWKNPVLAAGEDLKPNEILVDPLANEDLSQKRVFQTLSEAITYVDTHKIPEGYVILLKTSATLDLPSYRLNKADLDLTIKPHGNSQPVLKLAPSPDAALFHLFEGKLHLEKLEFLLASDYKKSLVAVAGNGHLSLSDCLITLKPKAGKRGFNVVNLLEANPDFKEMPKSLRTMPVIRMHNCFVRGEGRLLTVNSSKPLEIDLENSLIALKGDPAILIHGNNAEIPADNLQKTTLRMSKVSTFLYEPLLLLKGGVSDYGFYPLYVEKAKDSLFVNLENKPLIFWNGLDSELKLQTLFDWKGEQNAYSGYNQMVEWQRPNDINLPSLYRDKENWGEEDALFIKRPVVMMFGRDFSGTLLKDFWPLDDYKMDLIGKGADLDFLPLPRPVPSP